jgi:hypothetical protein
MQGELELDGLANESLVVFDEFNVWMTTIFHV